MTVLSAIQRASAVIAVDIPTLVFTSQAREHQELQAVANEMAAQIVKEHDWNALKARATITGDGVTGAHAFPSDYGRMLKEGQLWHSEYPGIPMVHVTDSDIWLSQLVSGEAPETPQWTVFGGQINILPVLAPGETASYFYIQAQPEFTADTDTFPLYERLLSLGIIWKWKSNKGHAYAEDMQTYSIELDAAIDEDMGAGILHVGTGPTRAHSDYIVPVDFMP